MTLRWPTGKADACSYRSVGQINLRSALTLMPLTPWRWLADGRVGCGAIFESTTPRTNVT